MSGYRTSDWYQSSDNRTFMSGFQTDWCRNRFQTGLELVSALASTKTGSKPVSAPGCPVEMNWNRTSDNRRLELESTGLPEIRTKSGRLYNRRVFEISENRTSGFRIITVYRCRKNYMKSFLCSGFQTIGCPDFQTVSKI